MSVKVIDKDLRRKLNGLSRKLNNSQVPLKAWAEYFKMVTQEDRFEKEQTPDGRNWKAIRDLKPNTWKYKRTKKILTETSDLRNSLSSDVTDSRVIVGVNTNYAKRLQGTWEYLGVNDDDLEELEKILTDYWLQGL